MKYYPKSKIKTGLYAHESEWMYSSTGVEYVGPYFEVPDGVYTGTDPSQGNPSPIIPVTNTPGSSINLPDLAASYIYDGLKKTTNVKGMRIPMAYYPSPTQTDYDRGHFIRCFTRKKNDINGQIIEISTKQLQIMSNGLVKNFYYPLTLKWKISGPKFDILNERGEIIDPGVIDSNRRTLFYKERDLPGIMYKNQNLLKFSIYPGFANINDYTTDDQGFTG